MELGPFYTGQVPLEPLTVVVRDAYSNRAVDLTGYDTAVAVFLDGEDQVVMTEADEAEWAAEIANPSGGEVRIPLVESPFQEVGDHKLQVVLRTDTAEDITSIATFEVYARLGA